MAFSHDVRIYNLARRKNRKRGHGVRWNVAGRQFSKWFEMRTLADSHRSKLPCTAGPSTRYAVRQPG